MTQLRPIEDAPQDGTPILIPTGDPRFPVACVVWCSSNYFGEPYGWKNEDEGRHSPEFWVPVPIALFRR